MLFRSDFYYSFLCYNLIWYIRNFLGNSDLRNLHCFHPCYLDLFIWRPILLIIIYLCDFLFCRSFLMHVSFRQKRNWPGFPVWPLYPDGSDVSGPMPGRC